MSVWTECYAPKGPKVRRKGQCSRTLQQAAREIFPHPTVMLERSVGS